MDNFSFDVTSEGLDHLVAVLGLLQRMPRAFKVVHPGENMNHMAHVPVTQPTLVLFDWAEETCTPTREPIQPFLARMTPQAMGELIMAWLSEQKMQGKGPDIDGSVGVGWRAWNTQDAPEYVDYCEGSMAVRPAWALYHK